MKKLLLAAVAATVIFAPMAAQAGPYGNFCASQRYETIGGKRTKICCNSQGFCTTEYGIYNK